jgi:hypothetical protein
MRCRNLRAAMPAIRLGLTPLRSGIGLAAGLGVTGAGGVGDGSSGSSRRGSARTKSKACLMSGATWFLVAPVQPLSKMIRRMSIEVPC